MFWLAVHDCIQQTLYWFLHLLKKVSRAWFEKIKVRYMYLHCSYFHSPFPSVMSKFLYSLFLYITSIYCFFSCFQEYLFRCNSDYNTWQLLKKWNSITLFLSNLVTFFLSCLLSISQVQHSFNVLEEVLATLLHVLFLRRRRGKKYHLSIYESFLSLLLVFTSLCAFFFFLSSKLFVG